ncbi:LPXTG cell wall anchor domain-containing protein [Streptomyces ferrugineus]|uniref:LPXTG cell wall anchor domain-containing protein n=1 Tax=Streptomyces ferrugineus TaxID=1413221 RepID=A0A7M2SL46_9ACTN|nr:LPXTG cell wall anchor domain-containing protein [Streptomyces ferrugineus]QOV36173.1 LPXTG cell wall anchor domain-containing protein [Streptomyces ferrugineus]
MKLRRALAAAATTAVIAPIALLSAPVAFATGETTPTPTASEESTTATEEPPTEEPAPTEEEPTPTEEETTPEEDETSPETEEPTSDPKPSSSATEPSKPSPSASAPEESEDPEPEPSICEDTKIDVSIKGLPGKIAAGSGWHKFSLNFYNPSDSTLNDLFFFAGTAADKEGLQLFKTKQVHLQAYNPVGKAWEDVDIEGYSVGGVGWTDELQADYEVNIPMRLNVSSSAPVGAGFTLGGGAYTDSDADCDGWGETSYKFQIVAAGTDTDDTKPQTGGKLPVPSKAPAKSDSTQVTGSLAETGSSSNLPVIGTIGGVAIVAGAGVVFAMKRRKVGAEA